MSRPKAVLFGLLAGCLPVSVATGTGAAGALALAGGVLVVSSLVAGVRSRTLPADTNWAIPTVGLTSRPAGPRRGGRGGVAMSLGRVESARVLDSAAYWAGVAFAAMSVWVFGWEWGGDDGGDIGRIAAIVPWLMHPLVGMLLVAAHRARTRARRDGLDELFTSCPATDHQRDVGHLASAWVGALTAVVLGAAVLVVYRVRADVVWGAFGGRQIAQVVGCGLLAVGATALGVLLARWAPWGITPVVAIVVIGVLSLQLPAWGGDDADGFAQLSTAPVVQGFDWLDSELTATRWVAHLAWIAALVACVVAVLMWTGRPRRRRAAGVAVIVAVTAASRWIATRPITDADAARIASMIEYPERHQDCTDLGVPFCVYRGNGALVDAFRPHLSAVLASLPAGVQVDGLVFRQGADVRVRDLADEVVARLEGWRLPPGVAPVKLDAEGYAAARFWLALAATEIVDETGTEVVDLAGQARGVLVIWLATRGVAERRALTEMASLPPLTDQGEDWYGSRPWPDPCRAGPTPVRWAHSDLEAARLLIATPHDDVVAVVHARWEEWLDPATSTDTLLAALGFDPVGVSPGRTPVVGSC